MSRDRSVRGFFAAFAAVVFAGAVFGDAGCASNVSGNGDETHFETCTVDADCKADGGAQKHCVVGICRTVIEDAGTGGADGRNGAGGASSAGASGASTGGRGLPLCELIAATNGDSDAAAVKALLGDAAASCTLRASDYDRSCTKDADCVAVGQGNACTLPCAVKCQSTAINSSALAAYQADYDRTPLAACPDIFCGCPAQGVPRCSAGTCELAPLCGAPCK